MMSYDSLCFGLLPERKLKAKFDYKKYDLLPETGTFKDQIAINDDIQVGLLCNFRVTSYKLV